MSIVTSGNRLIVTHKRELQRARRDCSLTTMTDTQSNILPSASVTLGLLLADVNGDGSVTKTDSSQVKLDQGKTTDATNFRADVNASSSLP